MSEAKEVIRLNLNIPSDLHKRIKVQCAMKNLNMTEALIADFDRLFPPMNVANPDGKRAGKRSDPQWEQTTVFLKKDAKRKALRRLEDSGKKRDLSELLQSLLDGFLVKEIPF